MKLFGRNPTEETPAPQRTEEGIPEDRGIPSVNRVRSVQARVSSLLAITLMTTLGAGLLTWYYARALSRPHEVRQAAQVAAKSRAQGEMPLPSLGPITPPVARAAPAPVDPPPQASAVEQLLGPAPELPHAMSPAAGFPLGSSSASSQEPLAKSPGELALERRLAGPAFAHASSVDGPMSASAQMPGGDPSPVLASRGENPSRSGESGRTLDALLKPSVTTAVTAAVLPTRQFLLSKGTFIDCTLETAIDSTLPGMTTCVTATDTFSSDGSVVLLERGTKLVGETRGEVSQGAARVFVLWSEARTPTGVAVPLSSPGTDELGRSGLPGEVNRHFWDRFGAAILLTVINGAVQGAVNSQNSGGSIVVSPATSTDVMTEILRSTVNIAPTVTKAQGDRIQVFVARDVDFRSVYELRVANAASGKTP